MHNLRFNTVIYFAVNMDIVASLHMGYNLTKRAVFRQVRQGIPAAVRTENVRQSKPLKTV